MNKQQSNPVTEQPTQQGEHHEPILNATGSKKQFVEPVVSVPVDVLEATSFFQGASTIDTSDV